MSKSYIPQNYHTPLSVYEMQDFQLRNGKKLAIQTGK